LAHGQGVDGVVEAEEGEVQGEIVGLVEELADGKLGFTVEGVADFLASEPGFEGRDPFLLGDFGGGIEVAGSLAGSISDRDDSGDIAGPGSHFADELGGFLRDFLLGGYGLGPDDSDSPLVGHLEYTAGEGGTPDSFKVEVEYPKYVFLVVAPDPDTGKVGGVGGLEDEVYGDGPVEPGSPRPEGFLDIQDGDLVPLDDLALVVDGEVLAGQGGAQSVDGTVYRVGSKVRVEFQDAGGDGARIVHVFGLEGGLTHLGTEVLDRLGIPPLGPDEGAVVRPDA